MASEAGHGERALELFALAARYPFVANSAIFQNLVGKPMEDLGDTLPVEIVSAARERGSGLDLWTVIGDLGSDPLFAVEPPR